MDYSFLDVFLPAKEVQPFERVSKSERIQTVIDEKTGTIEWRTAELTQSEVEQLQALLGYKKPKAAHWNAVRNALAVASIAQVAAKNRGKKGWSESELKAASAALSRLK